jgi:hypothetical protein
MHVKDVGITSEIVINYSSVGQETFSSKQLILLMVVAEIF